VNHEIDKLPNFQEGKPEELLIKSKELLGKWSKECPQAKNIITLFKKYANLKEANCFSVNGENKSFGISAPSKEKIKGKTLGYVLRKWSKNEKYLPSLKCNFTLTLNEQFYKFPDGYGPLPLLEGQLDEGDKEINFNDLSTIGVGRMYENSDGEMKDYIERIKENPKKTNLPPQK